jgi:hypothetical protein
MSVLPFLLSGRLSKIDEYAHYIMAVPLKEVNARCGVDSATK